MKHTGLLTFLVLFLLSGTSYADDGKKAPLDPIIHTGKLKNGFTYYIVKNQLPPERAFFQLAVNAGGMNETSAQNGLAHFCEHMAFNGTKNFPDKKLRDYLESYGVSFGGGFNAYTNQNRTIYLLNSIPTTNASLVDSCLLIMHDWASAVSFLDEEIDKERGVIREEWRLYGGANRRMGDVTNPIFYNKSRYAEHNVIGKLDVINNAEYDLLRSFYKDWYRPDNQALIVVGDIDVKEIEKKIKKRFGKLKRPSSPMREIDYSVAENKGLTIAIATDKEASRYSIRYSIRHKGDRDVTVAKIERNMINSLYFNMLSSRFNEERQKPNPKFLYAGAYYSQFSKELDAFTTYISPLNEEPLEGLKVALTLVEQAKRYGFTESELERAKKSLMTGYKRNVKEKGKRKSKGLAFKCQRHFLDNWQSPDPEYMLNLAKEFLPSVTLEQVNAKNKEFYKNDFQGLVLHAPEKKGVVVPTEKEIRKTIADVAKAKIDPYEDEVLDAPLIAKEPEKGSIREWKKLPEVDGTMWVLSNGAKVVWKTTDNKDDEVLLSAFSPGGSSHVKTSDLPSSYARSGVSAAGLGEFSSTQLKKKLTGKVAYVNTWMSESEEGFRGSSSVKDFETMMRLLYLKFTDIRKDDDAWNSHLKRRVESLSNAGASPKSIFRDSVGLITNNYHERRPKFCKELLKKADYEKAIAIMKDRFQNAEDFTFVFVGNVDTTKFKPLVERYIGSLPSNGREEHAFDHGVRPPMGDIVKHFTCDMKDPKGFSWITYTSYLPDNLHNKYQGMALKYILGRRFTEEVREKVGGTYGVGSHIWTHGFPKGLTKFLATYNCDPERVQELNEVVYSVIKDIKANGPTDEEINITQKYLLKKKKESMKNNQSIVSAVQRYLKKGYYSFAKENYEDQVEEISKESVHNFAKKLFVENRIEIVMTPKAKAK